MQTNVGNFPRQRLSISQKGKDWRENVLDWAENVQYLNNGKIRKSLQNKKINFDLYGGKIHLPDLKLFLNPYNKVASYIPNKIQHYPVMNQPLDLLVGEEINRKNPMIARVVNPDAVSQYEEEKVKIGREIILEFLPKDIPEDQIEAEAKNLLKYMNYNYQDLREVRANWVFQDASKRVEFDRKLQEGLKHVVIASEEIYLFDVISGEPYMELLNPKKVYTFRSGQSSRVEDSDIIIINDYWSPGKIHDVFYDKLKKGDLKKLDELVENPSSAASDGTYIDDTKEFIYMPTDDPTENVLDGYIDSASALGMPVGDYMDSDGNLRVLRVYWRSQRKLLKVKSYDPETGEVIETFHSESYKPRKELGEEVETYWVNEWWRGTKIGNDIYVDIKPKELQYRRMSNPSICHPGIVGQIYNTNQMRAQSMVDKMKPLQYLFDVVMDKLIRTIANHVGKVGEVDLAKVAWDDIDKFLHFVRTENLSFNNSFKESTKGQAAGHFNTVGGKSIDLDQSQAINMFSELLQYIRNSMYDIVGITPQRLGQVSNRETVGGVERSVTQSSHITSELFAIHDNVKKRCAEVLLETAKYALKGNKKKVPYVTTEGITAILEIDGDEFAENDYGIYMEHELDLDGLRQKLEQVAQAWSQNDTVKPSTLLSIYTDKSMESIKRKLENDYDEKLQREMEQQQQMMQQQQVQAEAMQELEERKFQLEQTKLQLDDLKNQRDNATKIQLEMLKLQNTEGQDNNLEIEKLQVQKDKLQKEIDFKYKQLDETIRHNMAAERINKTKINKK